MVDKDKGKGETTWGGSQGLARLAASALGVLATEALFWGLHKHPCGLMIEPAQSAMCTREFVRGNSMQIMLRLEDLQRCQLTGHGLVCRPGCHPYYSSFSAHRELAGLGAQAQGALVHEARKAPLGLDALHAHELLVLHGRQELRQQLDLSLQPSWLSSGKVCVGRVQGVGFGVECRLYGQQ